MKTGHVRRAKPSSHRRVAPRGRRIALLSLALPAVLVAPMAWHAVFAGPPPGQIDAVIREAGFEPVHPPSRLYGPGALYVVDGNAHWKVCDADPALLAGKIETSPTETRLRQILESDRFSFGGEIVERVLVKLGAKRSSSVEYRVTDVHIAAIDLANLYGIQDALLHRAECDKAVGHMLDAKKQVCLGAAAFSATVKYQEQDDATFESSGRGTAHSEGDMTGSRHDQRTGENLFYGIRLWRVCITPSTATEPSVLVEPKKPPAATPVGAT